MTLEGRTISAEATFCTAPKSSRDRGWAKRQARFEASASSGFGLPLGFETRRLLKWRAGTTIALALMVLGGMMGLLWKVFAA